MNELSLYPLKFQPVFKEKIWGGSKLKNNLSKIAAPDKCGESWEISAVEGSVSIVKDGFLKGSSLQEICEIYLEDLLGPKVYEKYGNEFPLLVKFIDANDNLSVQVHPNDEVAIERHNSYGKTEAWYVLDAEPGAKLVSGFNTEISKSEFVARVNNGDLLPVLNQVEVNSGDLFFLPAGRVHAIGEGILLCEIQQTSDITYRIYDWDRVDDNGNSRELHNDLALDVIKFEELKRANSPYEVKKNEPGLMLRTDYFVLNMLDLNVAMAKSYADCDSFVIYICVVGSAKIVTDDYSGTIQKGETLLIPFDVMEVSIIPENRVKILEVFLEFQ
jgi:mannose-6-phosphate isomerase